MTTRCRICDTELGHPDYTGEAPSIASTGTLLPVGLAVTLCRNCSHAQSSELPELKDFYDNSYRISLSSEDHDQLYDIVEGREVFRTDKQSDMVLGMVDLAPGMSVLDYGAAKAVTLRKVCNARPGLMPHLFDVSSAYTDHWAKWIDANAVATYNLPDDWTGKFDVVTAHFVLEHVPNPLEILQDVHAVLKPGGTLFLTVPNLLANTGDFLVADHINHFTVDSLGTALGATGFTALKIDTNSFRGAIAVVTYAGEPIRLKTSDASVPALEEIASFWREAAKRVVSAAKSHAGVTTAIYGAGFYGSFIATCIDEIEKPVCFVDRNPHVRRNQHFNRPVVAPHELPPEVSVIYAGLNPAHARAILGSVEEWQDRDIEIVYLSNP